MQILTIKKISLSGMSPADGQPQIDPPVQKTRKFHVVPVPGEFSRGRWKCVDTRGGSAMGVFGDYPPDDEYKSVVTMKNNLITVRKKFYRRVPEPPQPEPSQSVKKANHITVVSSTDRVYTTSHTVTNNVHTNTLHAHISPRQEVEVIVMTPSPAMAQQQQTPSIPQHNPVTIQTIPPPQTSSTVIISSQQTHTTPNPAVVSHSPSNVPTPSPIVNSVPICEAISTNTSNTVVAIDNKIVQAMDLVKTHLTVAVREEVETLRQTISDLESRLSALREENRVLRDNVAPDVLALITNQHNGM